MIAWLCCFGPIWDVTSGRSECVVEETILMVAEKKREKWGRERPSISHLMTLPLQ